MISVLDHGFVKLVDHMGDDNAIVQAARVSFGQGIKTPEEDESLIRYLMRNNHTSPFEMVEFKFHIKMPIFIARQWVRHRTASINEYSGRYSEMKNEFYVPVPEVMGKQDPHNKQCTLPSMNLPDDIAYNIALEQDIARHNYEQRLSQGVSKEYARINLPLSQYTEMYWKIDLHNLFNFIKLRSDSHAQWEIRQYAEALSHFVMHKVPWAFKAFRDYKLKSVTFSPLEQKMLKRMFDKEIHITFNSGIEDYMSFEGFSRTEKQEFLNKLGSIIRHG